MDKALEAELGQMKKGYTVVRHDRSGRRFFSIIAHTRNRKKAIRIAVAENEEHDDSERVDVLYKGAHGVSRWIVWIERDLEDDSEWFFSEAAYLEAVGEIERRLA